MTFKLTYSTMFDSPEEMHSRFEAALAELRDGLGASHAIHIDGEEVAAARTAPSPSPVDRRLAGPPGLRWVEGNGVHRQGHRLGLLPAAAPARAIANCGRVSRRRSKDAGIHGPIRRWSMRSSVLSLIVVIAVTLPLAAEEPVRARDLGIPFDGSPGPWNAITDVAGVTVGHSTIIEDLPDGHAVRTGVTAILPRGEATLMRPVFGAWFALNGNGEMTGTTWIEESGQLEGPVMLTNTHSVGVVRDATIAWRIQKAGPDASGYYWSLPVVAETWDGHLNDINGFHVTAEHVAAALGGASSGPVAEGNVGGGTGMVCYEFKGGIGTSSRVVEVLGERYTLGALVQANYGLRAQLRIAGVPVGRQILEHRIYSEPDPGAGDTGSIIVVIATDAPLLPHQLKRIARRASLGLGRNGSISGNGSGDIFIAFSSADGSLGTVDRVLEHRSLPNDTLDPVFAATVQATEEAIVNALVAARDMVGDQGHYAKAIPHQALREIFSHPVQGSR
jgi:D-aminopeptidase